MNRARLRFRRFAFAAACLPVLLIATTGCLANATGLIGTPGAPTETGSSRLPSLLQQLQASGGAGLEVFSTPENQVLAAQDSQGKGTGPTNFGTPITTLTPTVTITVAGASTAGPGNPTPTPRNEIATSTPRPGAATPTPSATRTPSATSTPSPTATAGTPTPTPAPPTATPTPCASHTEGNSCATPPPEGG